MKNLKNLDLKLKILLYFSIFPIKQIFFISSIAYNKNIFRYALFCNLKL